MPVQEVRSRVHSVCVTSITTGLEFEGRAERLPVFDAIFLQETARTGWTVVEPSRFEALALRVASSEGGSFDTITGEQDVAKAEAIVATVRKTAREELGCDGFLHPELVVVTASWGEYGAGWDGVRQAMGRTANAYGHVPALSIRVRLEGMDGEEVFYGTGGVQVLSTLESTGFLQRDFASVSEASLLANNARLFAASRAALAPFLPPAKR